MGFHSEHVKCGLKHFRVFTMLDEPHDMRLHMQRAIPGLYNLKDPPRSPNLRYPGPHWVLDSLRAAWCAAKTLTHCLPPGMPVTYEATRWMLEFILPDQYKHCEVGIELMLLDGCFTPEQAPYVCSSTGPSPSRWRSHGLLLDEMIQHQEESRVELAKLFEELKLALIPSQPSPLGLSCEGSLAMTPQEWVVNVLQAINLGTHTVFREQSRKTVLIREPPNGSSPSSDKLLNEAVHPSQAFIHSSSPWVVPQGGNILWAPPETIQKVSASKTRSSPEQVQMARSKASPSSAKPDAPLVPLGLPTGLSIAAHELQTTREPLTGGTKPVTLSSSMVTPIFWTSPSLGMSVKTREQSIKTVLHRELLKGNSLTGIKPSSRIISAPAATMRTVGL